VPKQVLEWGKEPGAVLLISSTSFSSHVLGPDDKLKSGKGSAQAKEAAMEAGEGDGSRWALISFSLALVFEREFFGPILLKPFGTVRFKIFLQSFLSSLLNTLTWAFLSFRLTQPVVLLLSEMKHDACMSRTLGHSLLFKGALKKREMA